MHKKTISVIGILLILVEISENIYAIRNGGKGLDQ